MKKMIMAAVAMAAAISMQAASVDWTLGRNAFKNYGDTQNAGGTTLYLLNTASSSYAALISGIGDGSIKAADISSSAAYLGTATTANRGSLGTTTTSHDSLTAGETYSLVFVAFNDNADYFYTSAAKNASAWDATGEYSQDLASVATWGTDDYASSGWTAISSGDTPTPVVPEPTSGVLMLVGMGVLALRRKRA